MSTQHNTTQQAAHNLHNLVRPWDFENPTNGRPGCEIDDQLLEYS